MNTWTIRLLAGAACTAGVLAGGATLAHADTHHGLVDVKAIVKIGNHHGTKSPVKVHVGARVGNVAKVHVNLGHHNNGSSSSPAARTGGANLNVHLGTNRPSTNHLGANNRSASPQRRTGVNLAANVRLGNGGANNTSSAGRSTTSSAPSTYRKPVVHLKLKALPLAKTDVLLDTRAHKVKRPSAKPATSRTRPGLLHLKAHAEARVLNLPVDACIRLNASACHSPGTGTGSDSGSTGTGTGSNGGGDPASGDLVPGLIPAVVSNTHAAVLNTPVDACILINAGNCGGAGTGNGTGSGSNSGSTPGSLVPPVLADVDAVVLDTPIAACLRLNSTDCTGTTGTGGSPDTTPGNPALPVIGTDLTTTVTDLADATLCLRINGGTCATNDDGTDPIGDPGTPGTPTNPGTPGNPGNPGGNDDGSSNDGGTHGNQATATFPGSHVANTAGFGNAGGNGDRLAHTGATAGLLAILLAGLLMLLASGGLLRRRS